MTGRGTARSFIALYHASGDATWPAIAQFWIKSLLDTSRGIPDQDAAHTLNRQAALQVMAIGDHHPR